MFNISSFLGKFSKDVVSLEQTKINILEIILKQTQITLTLDQIEIKNCILHIAASPGVKNKVFMFKSRILDDIVKQINSEKIIDIR